MVWLDYKPFYWDLSANGEYPPYSSAAKFILRVLIIGFGSIGQRHSSIAAELGHQVGLISKQTSTPFPCYHDEKEAIEKFKPDAIVISNITSQHAAVHAKLRALKYRGPILIEKPVAPSTNQILVQSDSNAYVAYNLRWHPAVQKTKLALQNQSVISAQFYVGQHLSKWAPQRDYRNSYRAQAETGGGVLGDLSHEIDLALYLLGPIRKITGAGGHKSSLEIKTDDVFCAMFKTESDALGTLEMNYLDHNHTRFFNVVCDKNTYRGDLVNHKLIINGEVESFNIERNYTFTEQLKHLLESPEKLCSYESGCEVVECMDALVKSQRDEQWVTI